MDEVYRARDGGLEREVATKVLPASLDTQVKEIETRPLSVVLAEDTGLTR